MQMSLHGYDRNEDVCLSDFCELMNGLSKGRYGNLFIGRIDIVSF